MRGKVQGNTIAFGDSKYRIVALSGPTRVTPATMKTLEQFAKNGGIGIANEVYNELLKQQGLTAS